ncbi:MAG TPA: regulatory iron-sulfur-containing complex subunit RicT [Flavitalea sp.]|nr:regulatory iron-sulfur-containing complex subunit RicT [Flavitalea sp.]
MGCSSCGTKAGGKVSGCKSNGGCSTGSCNRMNVHDWLANLPFSDPESGCRIVEVSFNNGSRKDYYRNTTLQVFEKGDMIAVEGVSGFDVGSVNLTGEVVRLQLKKKGIQEFDPEIRKILRRATDRDLEVLEQNKAREAEAVIRSRAIARQLKLEMKISEVEIQADGRKATFFYIADDRVDFRELIKLYAKEFKVKVEMRQIGARQEAGKVGGIGSCGRELCCSTWLTDFKSVNTTAARYQNLSINQSKLSGQCGRLKCCLNYELDTYLDALQHFPENADTLKVSKGTAILIKKDIFRDLMWYILPDSSKQYPLTIERVKKIRQANMQNIIPQELEAVEVTSNKPKEVEPEFVDVVGQISLKTLEKAEKKKKFQNSNSRQGQQPQQRQGGQKPGQPGQQRPNQPQQRNQNQGPRNQPQGGQQQGGAQQRPPQGPRPQQPKGGQRPQNQRPPNKPGGETPNGNK